MVQLDSLGFVHLSVLHLKMLCGDEIIDSTKIQKFGGEVSNVLFQITSCLRNMMNSRQSKETFLQIGGKILFNYTPCCVTIYIYV